MYEKEFHHDLQKTFKDIFAIVEIIKKTITFEEMDMYVIFKRENINPLNNLKSFFYKLGNIFRIEEGNIFLLKEYNLAAN